MLSCDLNFMSSKQQDVCGSNSAPQWQDSCLAFCHRKAIITDDKFVSSEELIPSTVILNTDYTCYSSLKDMYYTKMTAKTYKTLVLINWANWTFWAVWNKAGQLLRVETPPTLVASVNQWSSPWSSRHVRCWQTPSRMIPNWSTWQCRGSRSVCNLWKSRQNETLWALLDRSRLWPAVPIWVGHLLKFMSSQVFVLGESMNNEKS